MSDAVVPPAPINTAQEVYGTFCGLIDQAALGRIFQSGAVATAPANNIGHVHLLFQSTGGTVSDGVCLYNYFRAFTIGLTLYNVGAVQSIAALAYLGAARRKTSARATFMLHRTHLSPQFAQSGALQNFAESTALDDRRTEEILRTHIQLTPEQWAHLDRHDLTISGEDAVAFGLADEIGEFAPPAGVAIFNI